MDSRHIRSERNRIYDAIRELDKQHERLENELEHLQDRCSHENKRLVADDWWQCPDCDAEGATDKDEA